MRWWPDSCTNLRLVQKRETIVPVWLVTVRTMFEKVGPETRTSVMFALGHEKLGCLHSEN